MGRLDRNLLHVCCRRSLGMWSRSVSGRLSWDRPFRRRTWDQGRACHPSWEASCRNHHTGSVEAGLVGLHRHLFDHRRGGKGLGPQKCHLGKLAW